MSPAGFPGRRSSDHPVIPIVVYHGKRTWEKRTFESHFGPKGIPAPIARYIPLFEYLLVDLRRLPDHQITSTINIPLLRVTLLLMKHIHDENLMEKLPLILQDMFKIINEEGYTGEIRANLLYLRSMLKEEHIEELDEMIEEWTESGARVGSIAWAAEKKAREEGIEIGEERGEKKNLEATIVKMLRKGFSAGQIADILEVDLKWVEAIQASLA